MHVPKIMAQGCSPGLLARSWELRGKALLEYRRYPFVRFRASYDCIETRSHLQNSSLRAAYVCSHRCFVSGKAGHARKPTVLVSFHTCLTAVSFWAWDTQRRPFPPTSGQYYSKVSFALPSATSHADADEHSSPPSRPCLRLQAASQPTRRTK